MGGVVAAVEIEEEEEVAVGGGGMGVGCCGLGFFGLGFMVWGVGFGVWGLGLGFWGLGFGVWGLGFGVWGLGFGVLVSRDGPDENEVSEQRAEHCSLALHAHLLVAVVTYRCLIAIFINVLLQLISSHCYNRVIAIDKCPHRHHHQPHSSPATLSPFRTKRARNLLL